MQQRFNNLHVHISLSRAAEDLEGIHGHFNGEVFADKIPDVNNKRCHICGPPVMMDAVKNALISIGVAKAKYLH